MNSLGMVFFLMSFIPLLAQASGGRIELSLSGAEQEEGTTQPVSGVLFCHKKFRQIIDSIRSGTYDSFNSLFEDLVVRHNQLVFRLFRKGNQTNHFNSLGLHPGEVITNLQARSPIPFLNPVKREAFLMAI
jgi:hypothetical protein